MICLKYFNALIISYLNDSSSEVNLIKAAVLLATIKYWIGGSPKYYFPIKK